MSEDELEDPIELIHEQFESRREVLKALSELNNVLSEDAERILQILEDDQE